MVSAIIANLEKLLNGPRDGALLRYSPGTKRLSVNNIYVARHLPKADDCGGEHVQSQV